MLCVILFLWMGVSPLASLSWAGEKNAVSSTLLPSRKEISSPLRKAVIEVKRAYWKTEFGRHLLALTEEIPIREGVPGREALVEFKGGASPHFVVDARKAESATQLEFEVSFVLARMAALLEAPVPFVDAEEAAAQAVLRYAMEKAAVSPEFSKRLQKAVRAGERLAIARKQKRDFADRYSVDSAVLFPGRRPKNAYDRLGYDIYLFSEDPYLFYESVVSSSQLSMEAVTLTELEDIIGRHGDHLGRGVFRALGRYALIESRVYPGRVLRAARIVKDQDGLARIRERLGLFRSSDQAEVLKAINMWIQEGK